MLSLGRLKINESRRGKICVKIERQWRAPLHVRNGSIVFAFSLSDANVSYPKLQELTKNVSWFVPGRRLEGI